MPEEVVRTVPTYFWKFRQNNSGGKFEYNAELGLSIEVWVEAPTLNLANFQFEDQVGGIFNGNECRCCGSRWEPLYPGVDVPETEPPPPGLVVDFIRRSFGDSDDGGHRDLPKGGFYGFVHKMDGTFYGYHLAKVQKN